MQSITTISNLPVQVGYLWLSGCQNALPNLACQEALQTATTQAQQRFIGRQLSADPTIQQIRQLFRAVDIDPTRYRPSGEALLRRALKGEAVRSINPLVDCNNIVSMETGLPFGCYDAAHVVGEITIRLGLPHEQYQGVAKPIDITHKLCAADRIGAFGSPISDSDRTKITTSSAAVLVLGFGLSTTPTNIVLAAMQRFADLAKQHVQAQVEAVGLVK